MFFYLVVVVNVVLILLHIFHSTFHQHKLFLALHCSMLLAMLLVLFRSVMIELHPFIDHLLKYWKYFEISPEITNHQSRPNNINCTITETDNKELVITTLKSKIKGQFEQSDISG